MNMSGEVFVLSIVVALQFMLIHHLRRRLIASNRYAARQTGLRPGADAAATSPLPDALSGQATAMRADDTATAPGRADRESPFSHGSEPTTGHHA